MYSEVMDRKLYLDDFAALVGVGSRTLAGYRSRRKARFPEPDGTDVDSGHARPWWWESTAQAWRSQRPGSGFWGPRHARAS